MKILLDACIGNRVRTELAASGHSVECVGEWSEDPGDDEILARAQSDQRVLITLDKDFGELAILHGRAHAGIVRLVSFSTAVQGRVCQYLLKHHEKALRGGAVITAAPGRVRVRPGGEVVP